LICDRGQGQRLSHQPCCLASPAARPPRRFGLPAESRDRMQPGRARPLKYEGQGGWGRRGCFGLVPSRPRALRQVHRAAQASSCVGTEFQQPGSTSLRPGMNRVSKLVAAGAGKTSPSQPLLRNAESDSRKQWCQRKSASSATGCYLTCWQQT